MSNKKTLRKEFFCCACFRLIALKEFSRTEFSLTSTICIIANFSEKSKHVKNHTRKAR